MVSVGLGVPGDSCAPGAVSPADTDGEAEPDSEAEPEAEPDSEAEPEADPDGEAAAEADATGLSVSGGLPSKIGNIAPAMAVAGLTRNSVGTSLLTITTNVDLSSGW